MRGTRVLMHIMGEGCIGQVVKEAVDLKHNSSSRLRNSIKDPFKFHPVQQSRLILTPAITTAALTKCGQ